MEELLQALKASGVVKNTATTAKEYTEPTLEVYKSGGLRLRGITAEEQDKVKSGSYYTITANQFMLFASGDIEQARKAKRAYNQGGTYNTKQGGDANISTAQAVKLYAKLPKEVKEETANKGVASLPLQVEQIGSITKYTAQF